MKAIYHVGQPSFFSVVWAVLSPLLGSKLRSRVHLLGGLEQLAPVAPAESLPQDLGGNLPMNADISADMLSKL
eukprot:CAMPEP_0181334828 /NCGR_PEP_ID=MMETSP1101-20121128/26486_1 /TAXON_ID=46948 /ORGANISM="Rhodomonas abbreviata, Strain Caron Lab Isolate" /LENGTH=72 /DNA_ID=CAMNT_0023444867 /DNA_START=125 /DNA_END=343 /DNA_ORIENTATION=-